MNAQNPARSRRSGRPAGPDSTRDEILHVAREAFAATGYDRTSVRAVAIQAGVDPSTVLHFFTSKDELFQAVISDAAPAAQPFIDALERRAPGAELVELYLGLWEGETSGSAVRALVRASLSSERATELLRETLLRGIVDAAPACQRLRAELALTHLLGVAIGRTIARLPTLGETDRAVIATQVGPVLDTYLHSDA